MIALSSFHNRSGYGHITKHSNQRSALDNIGNCIEALELCLSSIDKVMREAKFGEHHYQDLLFASLHTASKHFLDLLGKDATASQIKTCHSILELTRST